MIQFMSDIYDGMKTFMAGMKVTGGYLVDSNVKEKETVTTIDYDGSMTLARDVKVADRFRGHLHNDIERCIVCKACAKACPIDCFWIDGEKTESNKLRPSRFDIDLLKCMYCGLCVFACPTGCLTMTKEWWGATFHESTARTCTARSSIRRRLLRRNRKATSTQALEAAEQEEGRRRRRRRQGRRRSQEKGRGSWRKAGGARPPRSSRRRARPRRPAPPAKPNDPPKA